MSEKYRPANGDRVRVVLEGEVQLRPDGFNIGSVLGNYIIPTAGHVVSIEKITPPLPTTPGSVLRFRTQPDLTYTVIPGGYLFSHSRGERVQYFRVENENPELYDVLFDAGKVES